jgi:hypothetical protein
VTFEWAEAGSGPPSAAPGQEIVVPVVSAEMILQFKTAADRPKDVAALDRMRDILYPLRPRDVLDPPDGALAADTNAKDEK